MCVVLRDLIVFSVISDMLRGRPAVYATLSSYDEVAHHSGLERHDTLEALRKLDKQLGRIARAGRYAPRPYEIVVLSDHGQTQGATFKQRNGYGLDELVRRSIDARPVQTLLGGDENETAVGLALDEATRRRCAAPITKGGKKSLDDQAVVVLGSGNLGLIYLMEERHRLTLEEIEARHPRLVPGSSHASPRRLRPRPLRRTGARRARGSRALDISTRIACKARTLSRLLGERRQHLARSDGFEHAPDLFVNSFYDPQLDEGCAFEELISFHGGMGGSQTRPFILAPVELPLPEQPIVGAAEVHAILTRLESTPEPRAVGPSRQFESAGARVESALPQP